MGNLMHWLCLSSTLAWGRVVTTCVVLMKKHSLNNVITMWPCSDLYTYRLRVRQSKRTKYSHTCAWKGLPLCQRHINHTHSDTDTTHTHTDSHRKCGGVEKTQILEYTQKDAHTSPDTHTQRAVGILWLNLFMLEFLEKIVLKAAHHFCMRGDDWNCSASLFISVSSLFRFLSFVILHLWQSFTQACFQHELKPLFIFLSVILHLSIPWPSL